MKIPRPQHWDTDDDIVTIGRLGRHEKELLLNLLLYKKHGGDMALKAGWFVSRKKDSAWDTHLVESGEAVDLRRLRRETGILSRPVLSRSIKTLYAKRLITAYNSYIEPLHDTCNSARYTRYVGLTFIGCAVAERLNENIRTVQKLASTDRVRVSPEIGELSA
jgi:hypothetical protein